ncbi:MAG TPA: hypothetical protein PLR20_09395 [Syntrophales bacterium]|nr:hypothetical protein [Syntrophales bacterium]HOX93911.1 hypothetical protein [Syntrophales bacterium]HPI57980.1 hypothetical protein [Syntrophales bacterium]HPN25892.1 hypothetical protein [Syntrophales bacterium]HQM29552.1 hypothetical protein [Syntrophales bacterium]
MKNMLLEKVDYQVERTYFGTWRRYAYETGARFAEFKSHDGLLGLPFIHYTAGICPETGKRLVAKGIIAVGRKAVGVVAVGQAAAGLLALGQLAVGAVAIGQAAFGIAVIGQLAIAILFGLGQVTTGYVAIGQFALGHYALAQFGAGDHVWSTGRADPEAVEFFRSLPVGLKSFFGW